MISRQAAAIGASAAPSLPVLPEAVVDAHHHLWALDQGHYPWLQDEYAPHAFILGEYRDICRDFSVQAYREACAGVPVVATVHVEAERERAEALAETAWLHRQHELHGMPGAVVAWVDLLAPDAGRRLDEQMVWPLVRGVRCKPRTRPAPEVVSAAAGTIGSQGAADHEGVAGTLADPRWPAALALLAERGLCWDLRVPYWHLEEAAALLRAAPSVAVALEHVGLPWDRSPAGLASWRRGMQALAACPGVHLKLSELGLRDQPWDEAGNARVVAEALDIFGWQRCMFGSNFPVASLRVDWSGLVAMMQRALAGLDATQQRAVWHDNALAFYRMVPR